MNVPGWLRPGEAWRYLLGESRSAVLARLRFVALLFLVNRVLVYLPATITYLVNRRPEMRVGFVPWLLVRNFMKWDGYWYMRIAQGGYDLKSAAFFPLYPTALRLFHGLRFLSVAEAGLFFSAVTFFLLLWSFLRLWELDYPSRDARRLTWLLVLFPTASYFTGIYTESLFMLVSVLCLLFLRFRRWGWAALFGFLAGLTRNTGMLLAVPFLIEFWQAYREEAPEGRLRFDPRRAAPALWVTLIGVSGLTYMAFLWRRFGDPLRFAHAQVQYGRSFGTPWSSLYHGYVYNLKKASHVSLPSDWPSITSPVRFVFESWPYLYYPLQLVFVTLVAILLITSFRRIRWSYWAIILYSFLIPLAAPSTGGLVVDYFISFSRYCLVIVPMYGPYYELVKGRWPYRVALTVSVVLFLVMMGAWSAHLWVA